MNINKFKKYLAQRYNNINAKEELCSAFKNCAPEINIANVFDKITNIFVNIINDACDEPDGRCKKQTVEDESVPAIDTVKSDENHESLFSNLNITKEDISELKTLTENMSNTIFDLLKIGKVIKIKAQEWGVYASGMVYPELYVLNNNYDKLKDFKCDLQRYNLKYPNELFGSAIDIISHLKANSFIEYYSPFFGSSSLICELQDIFNKILDELKTISIF